MQTAILQSVAVLAGVSPVRPPQPAGPPRPGTESEPLEPSRRSRPSDRLELSDAWRNREADGLRPETGEPAEPADGEPAATAAEPAEPPAGGGPPEAGPRGADVEPLSDQEQLEIEQLRARDAEVRTHEQAHKAVGGRYAGAISYSYTTGPDGRSYVTGGSVPIDMSPVPGDPEATIAKMRIVRAAAMAPAEPSPQDRSVAAAADRAAAQAMTEASKQRMEKASPDRAERPEPPGRDRDGEAEGEGEGDPAGVAATPAGSIGSARRAAASAYRSGANPDPLAGLSLVA